MLSDYLRGPCSSDSSLPLKADGFSDRLISPLLARSKAADGREILTRDTQAWIAQLHPQLPEAFLVHRDAYSRAAARLLGVSAFTRRDHIYLGDVPAERSEHVLRHEIVHLAQVQVAIRTGYISSRAWVELEADQMSSLPAAKPVRCGADPDGIHPIFWFVAIGAGLYVLLRPGIANAPGPKDRTTPSPSAAQIIAEAICVFAVPGGAFSLGGRIGLGFLGSSALAGAAANVSLRGVSDAANGSSSPPLMYLFDAATGATIGFIVPGGVRLIGRAGTSAFDSLATFGLRKSDIAITKLLAEQAAKEPLTAIAAQRILSARGLGGQVSRWWMERRGLILLYRGQELSTKQILSPISREQGVAASEALVERLRSLGMSFEEIAGYTARWGNRPVPPFLAPPGMGGLPLGGVGIPTTRIPGIAANFGEGGIIYIIRVPRNLAVSPMSWQGLALENEFVILNQVPQGAVVQTIQASRVAPLMVDPNGQLVPGLSGTLR